jgi:type I restriction enzyme S subunit
MPLIDEYEKHEQNLSKLEEEFPEKLKKSILQYAVQGKLIDQNPTDEPASILLKKIKAEKEQLIKDKKIKKQKPLPAVTEEERPFEIPESWEWVRLGEIGKTQTGTTPSKNHPEYFNGEIPFIKPADITSAGIDYNNESLSQLGALKGRIIEKNSIMMVCIGGSIGKAYYTEYVTSCNQQINAITPFNDVSIKWLYFFTATFFFKEAVKQHATGTATAIINKSKWGNLLLPLPPHEEQKRIVKKTEKLIKFCDVLSEKKNLQKPE